MPLGCREAGGELERSLGLATVFFVEEGHEQQVAIPVGALADSQFPVPTVSVYEKAQAFLGLSSRQCRALAYLKWP